MPSLSNSSPLWRRSRSLEGFKQKFEVAQKSISSDNFHFHFCNKTKPWLAVQSVLTT